MNWKTIEYPGYFGKKRNQLYDSWNNKYGEDNWRIAWQWNSQIIETSEALQIYEDAYYEYFKQDNDIVDWLISTAKDVYDTAPTNINSGLKYEIQETPNNHYHDIAIRRALLRNGKWFKGPELLHVRGPNTKGQKLSPYNIPFHLPELISNQEIKDYGNKGKWWRKLGIENSVEEFYQQNKILQILD